MPLNVIIADDEYFIRQRLKKLIPWETLNLTLIGEAENGLQVLDLLRLHPVDLIILDIQMPQMTGIEVAQYIHTHGLHTKIIILSGYNDFEYAQKTLRLGVLDYLLKPVDSAALSQTLKQCTTQIIAAYQDALYLKKYYHYEKQTHLNNLLQGQATLNTLYLSYPELNQFPFSAFIALFINGASPSIMDQIKSTLSNPSLSLEYFKESDSIYVLQIFFNQTTQYEDLKTTLKHLLLKLDTYIFATTGELFYIERPWLTHYKKVLQALNNRYFYLNSHLEESVSLSLSLDSHKSLSKIRNKLTSFINSKDSEAFTHYIEECFTDVFRAADCHYLQTMLCEILLTYTIYYPQMITLGLTINEYVSNLLDEDYILEHLKNLVISYGLQCLTKSETLPSDVIVSQKIIDYIKEHYTELDLSVAKIAEHFDFNTSYIGTLFKKVTNQSILQYITTIRLEASRHLLESQKYKISEIAELVGYSDVFYYSKRFKKMYGYSPKEYNLVKISAP